MSSFIITVLEFMVCYEYVYMLCMHVCIHIFEYICVCQVHMCMLVYGCVSQNLISEVSLHHSPLLLLRPGSQLNPECVKMAHVAVQLPLKVTPFWY